MDFPETLLSTTIGAAVNFMFTELQDLLKEIRGKSDQGKSLKNTLKTDQYIGSKDSLIQWALKTKLDSQTEAEIKGLIEIIGIHKINRQRSQRIIAKMGGETFASPPQIAALYEAEESIEKLSKELIEKVEKLYGYKIPLNIY